MKDTYWRGGLLFPAAECGNENFIQRTGCVSWVHLQTGWWIMLVVLSRISAGCEWGEHFRWKGWDVRVLIHPRKILYWTFLCFQAPISYLFSKISLNGFSQRPGRTNCWCRVSISRLRGPPIVMDLVLRSLPNTSMDLRLALLSFFPLWPKRLNGLTNTFERSLPGSLWVSKCCFSRLSSQGS